MPSISPPRASGSTAGGGERGPAVVEGDDPAEGDDRVGHGVPLTVVLSGALRDAGADPTLLSLR